METDGSELGDTVIEGMVLVDGMPLGILDMLGPEEALGFSLMLEGFVLTDGEEDMEGKLLGATDKLGKVEIEGVLLGANSVEGDALTLGKDEG